MYLFEIGSVWCLIPRLLDGGLGIRRCVSYVNAIIPCDCLVFLERQCHPVASALTASALASLSLEDHRSEEEEEKRPRSCHIMCASKGGCLQCTLLQYVLLVAMYGCQ